MDDVYQQLTDADKHRKFTLEGSCPPVYNQLQLGSCVANAVAAGLRFAWKNSHAHIASPYKDFDPSRLWIYYYARLLGPQGIAAEHRDTGAQIRNALKVLKKKGVCEEQAWPYLTKEQSLEGKSRLHDILMHDQSFSQWNVVNYLLIPC